MGSPPVPFFIDGPCLDLAYQNTRDHPPCAEDKRFVEQLWGRFYGLADSHFREDARHHFLQRFWEMYLAVTLFDRGVDLHRHGDEGPEFYASVGGRRIWFEAIAPGPGDGPDRVPQLVFGAPIATDVPTEQILLRFTHALAEKKRLYDTALVKGIISPDDSYVLAINSRGIRHAPESNTLPFFIQAFLPFGPLTVLIDTKTGKLTESFYAYRPNVSKISGSSVSTRTFLDDEASFCSAVLHSSVDCANHPAQLGGDFSVLHNPNAQRPIDAVIFHWCEQFTFRDEHLHRSSPFQPIDELGPS
jgi:hypothetical protein